MRTFKLYRGSTRIADAVTADDLGVTIADDIARHFIYHMNVKSYGREIDKQMTHHDSPIWTVYPEDFGVPHYTIRKNK